MTPKEKALELVEQFSSVLMHDEFYEDSVMCARIAVDEVLKSQKNIYGVNNRATKFYLEVKHELEKL
jgi:hypothetical protein